MKREPFTKRKKLEQESKPKQAYDVDISQPVAMVGSIFLMNAEAAFDECGAVCAEQFISAVAGVVCHGLKQHQWDAIMESSKVPCGAKGCECEQVRREIFKALDLARRAVEAAQPKNEGHGNN